MSGELLLTVTGREVVADRVVALEFARADGDELPGWDPGAHVEFALPGGLVRQFSLCSSPDDRSVWRIAVLREVAGRGGSALLHDAVAVGDSLSARAPRNNFVAPSAAPWSGAEGAGSRGVVFVAGGIGITPILPMVRAAHAAGVDWRLLYLGRSLASMAFCDELEGFGSRVQLHPRDTDGPLALSAELDDLTDPGASVFACGPERMLAEVQRWWDARIHTSDSDARLHVEEFTPVEAVRAGDTAFEVEIADGTVIEVGGDESILAALGRCGIPALNSCQEGNCGTCETFILEGEAEHRDHVLSDEERAAGESMMICVSRARTPRLVLDL